MQFMLLYKFDPAKATPEDSPEAAAEWQQWLTLAREMREAGAAVAGAPLMPPETGTRLVKSAGQIRTADGPFAETKEVLGGFDLIEVEHVDAALEWARRVPGDDWIVDVIPVVDLTSVD